MVDTVVAAFQGVEVEGGAFDGDNLSRVLQFVQIGELQLIVIAGQALQVGPVSQRGGVYEVLDATADVGQGRIRAIVPDAGMGIIHVDAERHFLFRPQGGYFVVVQGEAHGRVVDQEAADALSRLVRHECQSGKLPLEVLLGLQVLFLVHQVVQQLLSPLVGQPYLLHFRLAGAGAVGEGTYRGRFRGQHGAVVQCFVIGQLDGIFQAVYVDEGVVSVSPQ